MASSPAPESPAALKRIGRYRIVRPLSKGGMALVYEARRESLAGVAPRVAIKVILPEHQEKGAFRDLFINEARLGARMQHQNLVQIQDFDQDGDKYFLVMEYVEGLTLRRVCSLCSRNNIPIPLHIIAEIGRQACDGLEFAHCAVDEQGQPLGLVHRDVKPSNLILNPQGVVKLLDFGISRGVLTEEREGAVRGTWGYMAPEQAIGQTVGPPTDVFGLATVLYELASLTPLFKKKKQSEIKRLLKDDHAIRMVATLDPSYQPLVPLFMRAMKTDRKERYESAAQFSAALRELAPEPISARVELVRFYETMQALNEGRDVVTSPGVDDAFDNGPEKLPADSPKRSSSSGPSQTTLVAGMAAGALGVALVIALLLSWLNQPPPGVTTKAGFDEVELPATVQVDNRASAAVAEDSHLSISVLPANLSYEVFVNGKFVKAGAVMKLKVDPGSHEVTVTSKSGSQKRFTVVVSEGEHLERIWDFERNRWRR